MASRRKHKRGGHVRSIRIRDRTKCHLCGQGVAEDDASRDHLRTRWAGGYDKASNYLLAHRACNTARGNMPIEVARAAIAAYRAAGGRMTQAAVCVVLRKAHGDWVRSQRRVAPALRGE